MEDNNLILHLPFDEENGSTTAHDFSQSRTNATVTDCLFVSGRQGKAIEFDGDGNADVTGGNINLAGDFTLFAWIKTGGNIGLVLQHGMGAEDQLQNDYTISPDWVCLVVVKEGLTVKVYNGTALIDTITLPAQLIGMGINQPEATDNGVGCIDEVRIYNVAATAEEVNSITNTAKQLTYSINGKPFIETWGIYVETSDGLLDRPAMKTPFSQDWPGHNGEVVDLEDKRVQPRDITLKCWMPCTSKLDFAEKWKDFCSQFEANGTLRLMVDIHPTRPLVYEVYLREALNVSKKWNDKLFVATFTLKMREPDPVKRVVRFLVTDTSEEHYIKLKGLNGNMLTVAWGDGAFTHNVYGDHTANNTALKHTYTKSGVHYAIVSGIIDDDFLSNFETDGIVVWNKF